MYGHLESLSVLLNHKATINCRPNGKAAIHVACETANVECLKILCNHGAKLNCFSMSGQAPLHFCTTRTSMPCAQQLVWRGKVKLWSVSHGMARDGGRGLWFLLAGSLSKYTCICPLHPQLTHVFISDIFSPSLSSEEVFPILIPHQICPSLSLATGPYSRVVSHVSTSSLLSSHPTAEGLIWIREFLFIYLFFLSSSDRFTIEMFSHKSAPLSSSFLFKSPWPQ